MYTGRDIAKVLELIAPLESGVPGDELGFIFGDPDQQVTGVGCTWCAHARSIQLCADQGLNMIICHEGIRMPEQRSPWYDGPKTAEEIFSNRVQSELLTKHKMVVYRSHSNWDALPGNGVADQAVAALQIEGLKTVARQKFFSVQEIPRPMTVRELKSYVDRGLDYTSCRIFGDSTKLVRRFSFLIGGFGENQFHMPQAARDMGAEALIIGEMSEFIVIAALEMGIPVIETLHSISEIPAIKRQAELLGHHLPDLPVHYIPSGAVTFDSNRSIEDKRVPLGQTTDTADRTQELPPLIRVLPPDEMNSER